MQRDAQRMDRVPVNPGVVEWCGDNPGIYLKHDAKDERWASLAVFFRVTYSPHGPGRVAIVLESPEQAVGYPRAANLCLSDNDALLRYLLDGFVSSFPTFRGQPGLAAMSVLPLERCATDGDPKSTYRQTLSSGDVSVTMSWSNLGEPFMVEVGPDSSATGAHDMYSLFVEARSAEIRVNDRALGGQVVDRAFFGRQMSSAFLALSETWVTPCR